MTGPRPLPGDVIRYSYLWARESDTGQEEGLKDRPCAVVTEAVDADDGRAVLTVLPVTHLPPKNEADAVELPIPTKRRLGLDDERSWILLTEANRFVWPGPDATPIPGRHPTTTIYGVLPGALFSLLSQRLRATRLRLIRRTQ